MARKCNLLLHDVDSLHVCGECFVLIESIVRSEEEILSNCIFLTNPVLRDKTIISTRFRSVACSLLHYRQIICKMQFGCNEKSRPQANL